MLSVTSAQLRAASPHGDPATIAAIAATSGMAFAKFNIDSRARALGFLSTAYEETGGFVALAENLYYSAERLVEVWPTRFPNLAAAAPYARNPEALANRVYGGRMGNAAADDGWRYRGRGLIQCTGHDNYALVQKLTGLPVLAQPDLVSSPEHMLECALALFVQYPGVLGFCDLANWLSVWALVGTGHASGQVVNLANHQAALAKLQAAIPALLDEPGPAVKPPVGGPPGGVVVPPVIPPVLPPAPLGFWARLRAWLASF